MASSDAKPGNPKLYGGMPEAPGPAGMAPRLLEFAAPGADHDLCNGRAAVIGREDTMTGEEADRQ